MPLPDTLGEPTVVPPVVQLVGADDCGPKTLMVIVPVELAPDEPARVELMELRLIGVPVVPVEGALAVTVGPALATTVLVIAEPQVLASALLFESPL